MEAELVASTHDLTEGGLLGELAEVACASGKIMYVYEERVCSSREATNSVELRHD